MELLINILVFVATFFFMEFMAWATHKYVMHGFLWYLHKDHHQKEPGFFEKNDYFFLIFALPSATLWVTGIASGWDFKVWIGAGIAAYGLCYFLVHDVLIHQRFKWLKKTDNAYFRAIRKAHKVHHKTLGKHGSESFGMLFVASRYFREARRGLKSQKA